MLNGIDVSAWQRGINAKVTPADFIISKVTESNDYVNGDCDRVYQQAKASNKKVGVYHFASGTTSGAAEADYFLSNIQGYIGEALLALDWEAKAVSRGVGYAKAFLDRVQERTGIKPLIYMSGSTTREYDWSPVVASGYGLWVAYFARKDAYTDYCPDAPMYTIRHWPQAAMLQYTENGRIPVWDGGLDFDVFYGDYAAWDAYAKGDANAQPIASRPASSTGQATEQTYTVQNGDTLSGIAEKYGTTYQYLAEINGIADPNLIHPGDVLKINGSTQNNGQAYTVQNGDTLSGIAEKYGTTYQYLAEINGIADPNLIHPGDVLKIS